MLGFFLENRQMLPTWHYPTDFTVLPANFGAFSAIATSGKTTRYPAHIHVWLLNAVLRRLLRKDEYVPYYRFVDAFSEAVNRTSNSVCTNQPPLQRRFFCARRLRNAKWLAPPITRPSESDASESDVHDHKKSPPPLCLVTGVIHHKRRYS